jgi:chorismate mutase
VNATETAPERSKVEPPEVAHYRRQIDDIDAELVRLVSERAMLSLRRNQAKQRVGMQVFQPGREQRIFDRVVELNAGPLGEVELAEVFRVVVKRCRNLGWEFQRRRKTD